jgi:hypothetical protein
MSRERIRTNAEPSGLLEPQEAVLRIQPRHATPWAATPAHLQQAHIAFQHSSYSYSQPSLCSSAHLVCAGKLVCINKRWRRVERLSGTWALCGGRQLTPGCLLTGAAAIIYEQHHLAGSPVYVMRKI